MSWLKSKAFGSWRRGRQLRNQLCTILSWQTNTSALSRGSSRSSSRSASRQSSISSVPSQPAGSGRNTPNLIYTGRTHTPPPPLSILQHPKTTRYGQLTLNFILDKKARFARVRGWNPAYQGSCIDPMDQSRPLDPPSQAPLPILDAAIRLLVKDYATKFPKSVVLWVIEG